MKLFPQRGEIWQYDLRSLYRAPHPFHKVEHWLIADAGPAPEVLPEESKNSWYKSKDYAVIYICMETGIRDTKVFSHREWGGGDGIDLKGNPYYKKVA